jgi:hypothetical protein
MPVSPHKLSVIFSAILFEEIGAETYRYVSATEETFNFGQMGRLMVFHGVILSFI